MIDSGTRRNRIARKSKMIDDKRMLPTANVRGIIKSLGIGNFKGEGQDNNISNIEISSKIISEKVRNVVPKATPSNAKNNSFSSLLDAF